MTSQEMSPGVAQTHISIFMVCCTAPSVCQHMSLKNKQKSDFNLQLYNTVDTEWNTPLCLH